jgi:outer membrane protein TolC
MLKRPCWIWGILLLSALSAQAEVRTLTLPYCLETAMEYNRELIQAREAVKQVKGSSIVVRSRYLPHLDLTANYDATREGFDGETTDHLNSQLNFSQRLFEFGPNAAQEVNLRSGLRQAVYGYEGKVYEIMAQVWETFHLILLQDRQIAIRRESREGFERTLKRQEARYSRRLATEEDVLSAELNVLNEELALSNLERQQFSKKMELLRLIGQPIGIGIQLQGNLVGFEIEQDQTVEFALRNSVQIALQNREVEEQKRVASEVNWGYSPDISLNAGVNDGRKNARLSIDKEEKTWGLNLASEYELKEREPPVDPQDESKWFTQVEARIPIFEGGSRLGQRAREKARLRQEQMELGDLSAAVELSVRQAYQSMLEAQEQQRIQEKQVKIARRRLEINQTLKDKGQADESLLEQVRGQFFQAQDRLFQNQGSYIQRQATLRRLMGHFE